ncbi:MAG: putative RNA methyltransferase [Pseudonocardiaceae bacterium]
MNSPVFACLVCAEPLPPAPGSYVCSNGHRFDAAREGYVNLLLARHRRPKDPGYSKEMIAGRRDFFNAGHYAPLADGVAELVRSYCQLAQVRSWRSYRERHTVSPSPESTRL